MIDMKNDDEGWIGLAYGILIIPIAISAILLALVLLWLVAAM